MEFNTYICLIPKKENSVRIQDFHPISLATGIYKIIAKVLASKHREVLLETLDHAQNDFMEGSVGGK